MIFHFTRLARMRWVGRLLQILFSCSCADASDIARVAQGLLLRWQISSPFEFLPVLTSSRRLLSQPVGLSPAA